PKPAGANAEPARPQALDLQHGLVDPADVDLADVQPPRPQRRLRPRPKVIELQAKIAGAAVLLRGDVHLALQPKPAQRLLNASAQPQPHVSDGALARSLHQQRHVDVRDVPPAPEPGPRPRPPVARPFP